MRKINIGNGLFAIIDNDDYERTKLYKWGTKYCKKSKKIQAVMSVNQSKWANSIYLHRLILNVNDSKILVDHLNMDVLDNRKVNLRLATRSTNAMNRNKQSNNTSGFKGVSWDKSRNKWESYINYNRKKIHLGRFDNKKEAANSYNNAAKLYHKEFARLNIIEEDNE